MSDRECGRCHGDGVVIVGADESLEVCPGCHGGGFVPRRRVAPPETRADVLGRAADTGMDAVDNGLEAAAVATALQEAAREVRQYGEDHD